MIKRIHEQEPALKTYNGEFDASQRERLKRSKVDAYLVLEVDGLCSRSAEDAHIVPVSIQPVLKCILSFLIGQPEVLVTQVDVGIIQTRDFLSF